MMSTQGYGMGTAIITQGYGSFTGISETIRRLNFYLDIYIARELHREVRI